MYDETKSMMRRWKKNTETEIKERMRQEFRERSKLRREKGG